MSNDDEFVRITLRIPRKLHESLNDAAAKKRSMNAEIIERLENSFVIPDGNNDAVSQLEARLGSFEDTIGKQQQALGKLFLVLIGKAKFEDLNLDVTLKPRFLEKSTEGDDDTPTKAGK